MVSLPPTLFFSFFSFLFFSFLFLLCSLFFVLYYCILFFSYFLFLISYFLSLISYLLFLISYFLFLISYFLFSFNPYSLFPTPPSQVLSKNKQSCPLPPFGIPSFVACSFLVCFKRIPSHTPTPPLPYHALQMLFCGLFFFLLPLFHQKQEGGEVVYLGFGCFSSSVGGFLCFFEMTISGLGGGGGPPPRSGKARRRRTTTETRRRTLFRPGGEEAQEEVREHHQGQEERQEEGVFLCISFFPFPSNIFFRFFLPLCFPSLFNW